MSLNACMLGYGVFQCPLPEPTNFFINNCIMIPKYMVYFQILWNMKIIQHSVFELWDKNDILEQFKAITMKRV